MASANRVPIPLRPVNVGHLLEAAEASGLDDEQIGKLIVITLPESLTPRWLLEPMVRRAANIPTLRLLDAIREVGTDE